MKDTETADNLLQAIAIVSSRRSSGRLQIKAGATRGAFFFRQGKLVDARMGPFTGLSAINLAVSLGETCQNFDPSISPPDSGFADSKERTIIRERFGIDTFPLEVVVANQPAQSKERERTCEALDATSAARPGSAAENREIEATKDLPKPGPAVFLSGTAIQAQYDTGPTASTTQQRQPRKTQATQSRTNYSGLRRLLPLNTRERFALRAGFIMLVVIPAAVVAASYWTDGKQKSPQFISSPPPKAEASLPAPAPESPAVTTAKTVVPEPNKAARKEVPANNDARIISEAVSDRPSKTVTSTSEDMPVEHSPSDKALTRTVVVVVEIAEGHVTQAYIQNPQAGLAGYESTALRMARERRYPKDRQGKEVVVLKVTGRQKL